MLVHPPSPENKHQIYRTYLFERVLVNLCITHQAVRLCRKQLLEVNNIRRQFAFWAEAQILRSDMSFRIICKKNRAYLPDAMQNGIKFMHLLQSNWYSGINS